MNRAIQAVLNKEMGNDDLKQLEGHTKKVRRIFGLTMKELAQLFSSRNVII